MFLFLGSFKRSVLFRILCISINIFFLTSVVFPAQYVRAQMQISLPPVGTIVGMSPEFAPAHMVGIQVSPEYPLNFNFLISQGDKPIDPDDKAIEYEGLIRYFMTALTVPEQELWVNLSPYESNRIIPKNFSRTAMGRDLLSLDYILKQLTSSLMYPEDELGDKFWSKVRRKAFEQYGISDIPISTFNKVWILPDKAVVYEKNGTAMIIESRLKVMLEEDLIALENEQGSEKFGTVAVEEENASEFSGVSSEVIRELVIPEIEKEVNYGKSFSNLRQIYSSMILASWFKKRLKRSIVNKVYSNQGKVDGINLQNTEYKQDVYEQYLESYKQGAYNYIKEEYDPIKQEIIPKKYFSGGVDVAMLSSEVLEITHNSKNNKVKERIRDLLGNIELDQVLIGLKSLLSSTDIQSVEVRLEDGYVVNLDKLNELDSDEFGVGKLNKMVEKVVEEGNTQQIVDLKTLLYAEYEKVKAYSLEGEYVRSLLKNISWLKYVEEVDSYFEALDIDEEETLNSKIKEAFKHRVAFELLSRIGVDSANMLGDVFRVVDAPSSLGRYQFKGSGVGLNGNETDGIKGVFKSTSFKSVNPVFLKVFRRENLKNIERVSLEAEGMVSVLQDQLAEYRVSMDNQFISRSTLIRDESRLMTTAVLLKDYLKILNNAKFKKGVLKSILVGLIGVLGFGTGVGMRALYDIPEIVENSSFSFFVGDEIVAQDLNIIEGVGFAEKLFDSGWISFEELEILREKHNELLVRLDDAEKEFEIADQKLMDVLAEDNDYSAEGAMDSRMEQLIQEGKIHQKARNKLLLAQDEARSENIINMIGIRDSIKEVEGIKDIERVELIERTGDLEKDKNLRELFLFNMGVNAGEESLVNIEEKINLLKGSLLDETKIVEPSSSEISQSIEAISSKFEKQVDNTQKSIEKSKGKSEDIKINRYDPDTGLPLMEVYVDPETGEVTRGDVLTGKLSDLNKGKEVAFADEAMIKEDDSYGGISLESKYLNLESRGESFDIPLPEEYMWMEQIPISGFEPQILEIIPAGSSVGPLPFFNALLK